MDLSRVTGLPAGTLLRIGDTVLEATGPCDPRTHIADLLGRHDPGEFQEQLRGRRGLLARVHEVAGDGEIRIGDRVEVLPPGVAESQLPADPGG